MATVISEAETVLAEPPEPPKDVLWEFVDGEYVEKHVGGIQNHLANELKSIIDEIAKAQQLGRVYVEMVFDFRKQNGRKRRPDVAFVSNKSATAPLSNRDWEVVPDLAVEVASQSKLLEEQIEKKNEYFELGVKQVWIVLPTAREIHVYDSPTDVRIFNRAKTLTSPTLLPGLELQIDEFFDSTDAMTAQAD